MYPRLMVVFLLPLLATFTLSLTFYSSSVLAERFDINLSDESAQFKYIIPVESDNDGRTEATVGFLYNDVNNYMAEASFIITDVPGTKAPGLEVGVGPKAYIAKHNETDLDAVSIGLGAQFRYKIPSIERFNLIGAIFYAPGIVSFADAEDLTEVFIAGSYEILPTANAYLGYRNITVDFDPARERKIDETFVIGLEFSY